MIVCENTEMFELQSRRKRQTVFDCLFDLVFLMFLFVSIVKWSLRCTKEWTVAGLNIFLQITVCCSHITLSQVASRILETVNQRWTFKCDVWMHQN
jgi:hypothetical protein